MKKINWGIIGTGSIASAFAHSISNCEKSELKGVYGRNEKALNTFATRFEIESYTTTEELFLSDSFDAIYVATPHNTHFEYSMDALKNGKHVLCEKPLAMNHLESMVLLNMAKEKGLFLMEAFMYRTHPQTFNILKALSNLQIKDNILINSSFGFRAEVAEDHRLRNQMLGGGSILDVGCYPLSMARLIAGSIEGKSFADPTHISASGEIDTTGVDLNSSADIVFSDYVKATISCAINKELSNNLEIICGETRIVADQPWHCGQFQEGLSSIKIYKNNSVIEEISTSDNVGLFTREIDHASACILEGKQESTLVSHDDTQGNMLWLDRWKKELGIECPIQKTNCSPITESHFFNSMETRLDKIEQDTSNKSLSRLALGCDNQTSRLHAYTMFDHFYGRGGRVFDTAYIYNNGKGDQYLGDWINLRGVEKEISVLGKGGHTPHCEPQFLLPQIKESLEKLNINKIDIFCIHRDNLDIPVDEFIDALNELRSEGLIDRIGASNWTLDRFSQAREYGINNGKEPFSVLSNNFSLAEMVDPVWPGCEGVNKGYLDYLEKNNVMLFPWSSQARGFFIEKKIIASDEHFSNPSIEEEKRVWHSETNLLKRERCFEIAGKRGVKPIEVALAYVIQKSPLIYPLIGPRTIFETDSSISAVAMNLTADEMYMLSKD